MRKTMRLRMVHRSFQVLPAITHESYVSLTGTQVHLYLLLLHPIQMQLAIVHRVIPNTEENLVVASWTVLKLL
jgi:hypothetical protein